MGATVGARRVLMMRGLKKGSAHLHEVVAVARRHDAPAPTPGPTPDSGGGERVVVAPVCCRRRRVLLLLLPQAAAPGGQPFEPLVQREGLLHREELQQPAVLRRDRGQGKGGGEGRVVDG